MRSVVNCLIECINNSQLDIRAYDAYADKPAQRPVMSAAVYFELEKLTAAQVEFSATVYSPLDLGGVGCTQKASEVCGVICDEFNIRSIEVFSVRYDKYSYGYTCRIKGTSDNSAFGVELPGGVYLRAKEFALFPEFFLTFTAQSLKVKCDTERYPIYVIYESEELDEVISCRKYKAELTGVSVSAAEMLCQRGRFSLDVFNTEARPLALTKCFCESIVYKSADMADVVIRGISNIG